MNEEKHRSLIKKLVANARAIISYQIGLPLGCAKMSRILCWLEPYEALDFRRVTHFPIAAGLLVVLSLLVGGPVAWWLSLRREVALASPDGRYSINLAGRFGRPVFGVDHTVYASVFDGANQVVNGREIHTGDWMDPWFDLWYPRHLWTNSRVLRLTRPQNETLKEFDEITVRNSSSRTVRFLRIGCRDMFLLLDINPREVVVLKAPMQRTYSDLSWLEVEGEFADKRDLQHIGKNFHLQNGSAHYSIDIQDDGIGVTLDHYSNDGTEK